jgi:hypothetical protein
LPEAQKKTFHAAEQDVAEKRAAWWDGQATLDASELIFVDG